MKEVVKKTKRRQLLDALLVFSPTERCHLDYVMHQLLFKGVCWPFLQI